MDHHVQSPQGAQPKPEAQNTGLMGLPSQQTNEDVDSSNKQSEQVYGTSHPAVMRADTVPVDKTRPTLGPQSKTERHTEQQHLRQTASARVRQNRSLGRWDQPFPYQFQDIAESQSDSSDEDSQESAAGSNVQGSERQGKRPTARPDVQTEQAYSHFNVGNDQFRTKGHVSRKDGRLKISINEAVNSGYIAKALGQGIANHLNIPHPHPREPHHSGNDHAQSSLRAKRQGRQKQVDEYLDQLRSTTKKPRLNIVVMVIGSRGDIQPFLRIGQILQKRGHRVRIATHPAFRDFVQNEIGLEFFSVGGDPSELMAFMVKNPGLIPSFDTVRQGEIQKRRSSMAEMFEGFWRACVNTTDDETDKDNLRMMGKRAPFIANALIANPPSFAHVHIAERLGIPLHIMFTFPYSPTQQFPHPLANIKASKSNVDANYVNFMSYPLVEMMTWQGLGDIVNKFRVNTLGLEPVSALWAPGATYRMRVPYTYMWSKELVPKPSDWGPEIDISGYVFLDLASDFKPPQDLVDFLNAGEPPVYIGFGSIVVDDPDHFTKMIFEGTKEAGVRALVSKGWGGIGGGDVPDNVHMLENTPHDWLFPKCSAVVHHGGAGTTAAGFKSGKPTLIVPFFGDQAFWGMQVSKNKAGAQAIPHKQLTAERLAEGIKQCLTDEARENAQRIARTIESEGDGAENAVDSFERSLPLSGTWNMRCSILTDRVAVWQLKHSHLRLSPLAAEILIEEKRLKWHDLKLLRYYRWNDFDGPGEPISGVAGAVTHSASAIARGVGMVPLRWEKHVRKRAAHEKRKMQHERKKAAKKQRATQTNKSRHMHGVDKATETSQGHTESEITPSGSAMHDATRPAGPSHADTDMTDLSKLSADPDDALTSELAGDAAKGLQTSGQALVDAPLDLHLAIAQGFHNAPRLYGDASVRKPIRIKGFKSGMRAATNEFAFGIWDGVTGLVTQPYYGWKEADGVTDRFTGLGVGFGKGIGGFVLKDISAVVTPPAFVGEGLRKEIKKHTGGPLGGGDRWIRRAHILQGQRELQNLSQAEDRKDKARQVYEKVDDGWRIMEDVWGAAKNLKDSSGTFKGRWMVFREKSRWRDAGALENVRSTQRALDTHKEGKDLDEYLRRSRNAAAAEQRRADEEEASRCLKTDGGRDRVTWSDQKHGDNGLSQSVPPPERHRSETGTVTSDGTESTKVGTPSTSYKDLPQQMRLVSSRTVH